MEPTNITTRITAFSWACVQLKILRKDAGHDLWEINTDYEVYQESSVITKTGLVKKPANIIGE